MTWKLRFCDGSSGALSRNSVVFLLQTFSVLLGVHFSLKTEFLRTFATMVAMEAMERRYAVGETF